MSFENMQLNEKLMRAVQTQRYKTPTEIQERAVPLIMEGKDILATADTGSGKTLAFILPALERILKPVAPEVKGRGPRVLILAPTRELANQIAETTHKMGQFMQFKFGTITGGVPYPYQERLLRNGCDLLIATPGRLLDHMDRGLVDFSRIEMFILDEADRMLDMGFRKDIDIVLESMPDERQTLLFSATLDGPIQQVAKQFLTDPVTVKLANSAKPHALISQCIHQSDDFKHKRALLVHVLEDPQMWQAIVFTKTKRGAEELANNLAMSDIQCAALHGDMKQSKRTSTLARVHRGDIKVLIATDVAARGLDVKNLSHVINFDIPNTVDDYVHRIGRTGRSGTAGIAISFVGPSDWSTISDIERVMGQRLERRVIEGLEPRNAEPRRGKVVPMQQNRKKMPPGRRSPKLGQRSEQRDFRSGSRSESGSRSGSNSRSDRDFRSGPRSSAGNSRSDFRSGPRSEQRDFKTGQRSSSRDSRSGPRSDQRSEHRDSRFDSRSALRTESRTGSRSEQRDSRSGSRTEQRDSRTGPRSGPRAEQRDFRSGPRSGPRSEQRDFKTGPRSSSRDSRSGPRSGPRTEHRDSRSGTRSESRSGSRSEHKEFRSGSRSSPRSNTRSNSRTELQSDRKQKSDRKPLKTVFANPSKAKSASASTSAEGKPKLRRKLAIPA